MEGGERSGKSTLLQKLYTYLTEVENRHVVKSFEPGGTPFGKTIRQLLLKQDDVMISPRAELMLFLADRAHHVDTLIKPALREGAIVLCDRFTDSSIAYQGAARNVTSDPDALEEICLFATGGLVPDLTFYLDLDPEIGLARIQDGKDRMEKETLDFHRRVRKGYLALAEDNANRFHILNASKTADEVFEKALAILKEVMKRYNIDQNGSIQAEKGLGSFN